MRPDQRRRLAELSNTLADTVIRDVDPANWTTPDMALCDMTKEQRGNATWCRKTAVQSVALLARVEQLLGGHAGRQPLDDGDTEAEIRRAEKAAAAMLDRVRERSHAGS